MIDKKNPPKFLIQTGTGRIYPYAVGIAGRADMEAYEMPVAPTDPVVTEPIEPTEPTEPVVEEPIEPIGQVDAPAPAAPTDPGRLSAIRIAIASIPADSFTPPRGGRPAMPKVDTVSAIVGFRVSADEIIQAL